MPDVKTAAIRVGDRVRFARAHHAHNHRLKRLVGKAGTVEAVGLEDHNADEYLVRFSPHQQWWIRARWLESEEGASCPK